VGEGAGVPREAREALRLARQKLLEAEMATCAPSPISSSSSARGVDGVVPAQAGTRASIADRPKWVGGVLATVGSYA
jgi:hypothetical protein